MHLRQEHCDFIFMQPVTYLQHIRHLEVSARNATFDMDVGNSRAVLLMHQKQYVPAMHLSFPRGMAGG